MSDFSNQDDYIDSRDVISRIDELSDEIDELGGHELRPTATRDVWEVREDSDGGWTIVDGHHASEGDAREAYTEEQTTELEVLEALQDEASGGDWEHGATLIRETYFEEYARQLADDIGAIDANATWPANCIDWERAADELQQDYTSVDYDGEEYLIRA